MFVITNKNVSLHIQTEKGEVVKSVSHYLANNEISLFVSLYHTRDHSWNQPVLINDLKNLDETTGILTELNIMPDRQSVDNMSETLVTETRHPTLLEYSCTVRNDMFNLETILYDQENDAVATGSCSYNIIWVFVFSWKLPTSVCVWYTYGCFWYI